MPVNKITRRFAELAEQADAVEKTKRHIPTESYYPGYDTVDAPTLLEWTVKCLNLLAIACGKDSERYRLFISTDQPESFRSDHQKFHQLKAVMRAAQEDHDGGYLDSLRSLVQAEVLGDELDQATELLSAGYSTPAAVVAGVVLEAKLRDLCAGHGIPAGKLDKMNSELAKVGEYDLLTQKRVTALADIRNNAAHGHPDKFGPDDVRDMIQYVLRFLAEHR